MQPSFNPAFPPYSERERQAQLSSAETCSKGHGRQVKRHLQASTRLAEKLDWPGVAQVCRLERTTRRQGQEVVEIEYAITSLSRAKAPAADLLPLWRGHWHIENRLHWVRDVTFGEDQCRVRLGHGPQNLAAFRNAAIAVLRHAGFQGIASALRHLTYRIPQLLQLLGILKK